MGTSRTCLPCSALLAAALAVAFPAGAEMYKWVDEKGVVTYSNTPPTAKQPKKIESVPERVSVYTPDAELSRAMHTDSRRDAKVASLGQQLEAERLARRNAHDTHRTAADRQAAAYSRCVAERGVDCEAFLAPGGSDPYAAGFYPGYYYPYVLAGGHHRPRPFRVLDTPTSVIGINPAPPVGAQPPRNIRANPPRQAVR